MTCASRSKPKNRLSRITEVSESIRVVLAKSLAHPLARAVGSTWRGLAVSRSGCDRREPFQQRRDVHDLSGPRFLTRARSMAE
jgi:hypothetical protein